jgi:hypothetical protein
MKKRLINNFAFGVSKNEIALIVDEESIDQDILAKCSYGIVKNGAGELLIVLQTPPRTVEYVIGTITLEQANTMMKGEVYVGAYTGICFEGEKIPQIS